MVTIGGADRRVRLLLITLTVESTAVSARQKSAVSKERYVVSITGDSTNASTDSIGQQLAVRQDHYCFGCGRDNPHGLKLTFFSGANGAVWADWTPSRENEGFNGIAHGGIITTVLDEVMGWAVYHQRIWAVTGKIAVSFRKPVEVGMQTRATARITEERGRKIQLVAELRRLSNGELLAEADAVFIKVPQDRAEEWQNRYIAQVP
jgi:acyl-coenzyme A thioesterase PaaI-like protein